MARDDKTEKPTPRRRQKAREKGQVVRSRDLIAACAALTALLTLAIQLPGFVASWRGFLRAVLSQSISGDLAMGGNVSPSQWMPLFRSVGIAMAAGWVVSLVTALAQGGMVVAPAALAPRLSRLNPAAKASQLF